MSASSAGSEETARWFCSLPNASSSTRPAVPQPSAGRAGASGRRKLNLVDWDGDGDLDLVSDGPNGPVWYENIGTQQKPVMQLRGNLLKTKMNGHNPTPYVSTGTATANSTCSSARKTASFTIRTGIFGARQK